MKQIRGIVFAVLAVLGSGMMEAAWAADLEKNSEGRYWRKGVSCPAFPKADVMKNFSKVTSPDEGEVELMKQVILEPGSGGICEGEILRTTQELTLYRVYGEVDGKDSKFGRWWSFDKPQGQADGYRKANAICKDWNDLKGGYLTLRIPAGVDLIVGTTQSVKAGTCKRDPSEKYEAGVTLQVVSVGGIMADVKGSPWK